MEAEAVEVQVVGAGSSAFGGYRVWISSRHGD